MKIEFFKGPAAINFKNILDLKVIKKSKDGITFTLNNKDIFVPWSNILAIEEEL